MRRSCRASVSLFLGALVLAAASRAQSAVDEDAVKTLRQEGLERSQVMELLSWICDVHGPRLTGSPNLRRAQEWAMKTFASWGLANPHLEAWGPFGRGWRMQRCAMHVTGENPWPVLAIAKAWSPSIDGRAEAEVVLVGGKSREEVEALDLRGKVVLMDAPREIKEPFDAEAKRYEPNELLDMANGSSAGGDRPNRPEARGAT